MRNIIDLGGMGGKKATHGGCYFFVFIINMHVIVRTNLPVFSNDKKTEALASDSNRRISCLLDRRLNHLSHSALFIQYEYMFQAHTLPPVY